MSLENDFCHYGEMYFQGLPLSFRSEWLQSTLPKGTQLSLLERATSIKGVSKQTRIYRPIIVGFMTIHRCLSVALGSDYIPFPILEYKTDKM